MAPLAMSAKFVNNSEDSVLLIQTFVDSPQGSNILLLNSSSSKL